MNIKWLQSHSVSSWKKSSSEVGLVMNSIRNECRPTFNVSWICGHISQSSGFSMGSQINVGSSIFFYSMTWSKIVLRHKLLLISCRHWYLWFRLNADWVPSMVGESWKYSFKSYYFESRVFVHFEYLYLYLYHHEWSTKLRCSWPEVVGE